LEDPVLSFGIATVSDDTKPMCACGIAQSAHLLHRIDNAKFAGIRAAPTELDCSRIAFPAAIRHSFG
jgi:hypothetical protein